MMIPPPPRPNPWLSAFISYTKEECYRLIKYVSLSYARHSGFPLLRVTLSVMLEAM